MLGALFPRQLTRGRRSDIAVPSMGESMSEGTIAVVLKQPGAHALCAGVARRTL